MNNNSCGILINDNHTDICFKVYSNRIFLIISQFKKFGSMIAVQRESCLKEFNSDVYSTKALFGKDEPEIHAAARFIAEQVNIDRSLLLSICLKDYNPDTVKSIVSAINNIKTW